MFCPKCGKDVGSDDSFCRCCGSALSSVDAASAAPETSTPSPSSHLDGDAEARPKRDDSLAIAGAALFFLGFLVWLTMSGSGLISSAALASGGFSMAQQNMFVQQVQFNQSLIFGGENNARADAGPVYARGGNMPGDSSAGLIIACGGLAVWIVGAIRRNRLNMAEAPDQVRRKV